MAWDGLTNPTGNVWGIQHLENLEEQLAKIVFRMFWSLMHC